ncbi:MAG TPA: hypothetical protein VKB55_06675 [Nocardioidaceae bacterium]|nr:hypothetical protein [Nocardioidaceae bacterium]
MNTVARPRGPLPPRVYWVRRLALLAVVLLVGWLMLRWIDGGGSGATPPDETPAGATQSEQPTPTQTKHRDSQRGHDKSRTAQVKDVAENFQRPHEECDLTQVSVVPSVTDPAYAGEPVQMTLRVSSASSSACSLSLDGDHLLVSISEGHDVVWDSTHCTDDVPVVDLALQPHWSTLVDFTWSGLHSGRQCTPDSTPADPGSYTVQAAVLEGEPSQADFDLVAPPKPPADKHDGKGKSDSSDQPSNGQPTDGSTPSNDQPTDEPTPSDGATESQT